MKTIEFILDNYQSITLDGRDLYRLSQFLSVDHLSKVGCAIKDGVDPAEHIPIPLTRENVLAQLEKDVAFGFEKALNQRGISSSLMFATVSMWNWILEEGLEDWDSDNYAMYRLPLFKATAIKYGFTNPIGEDAGTESKYA